MRVKVADFGIARIMDGSATRTKTGDLVGSPLYMSPEQIKGEHVSRHSDIFSLGVTFYQLLTGELPFNGENLANLSYQIVQCKFRPVNEVRPDYLIAPSELLQKHCRKILKIVIKRRLKCMMICSAHIQEIFPDPS